MKTSLPRVAAFAIPLLLIALSGTGQVVTDPSNMVGYDDAKSNAVSRSAPAAVPLPAPMAPPKTKAGPQLRAAAGCFIPFDASYNTINRNDDGSFGPIALPFTFNLYGSAYTRVWINTNGNLTFTSAHSSFSSSGFPSGMPMVAAFWADVDTRNPASGQIHYKLSATNLIVTWDRVGYYNGKADKLNTFQTIIGASNDALLGPGQNVSLRYDDMAWTTGAASLGANGFGGISATVGANKGNNVDYVQVGRFNRDDASYDGPGGASDGVRYLTNQCYGFQVSNAGNIPPSASNLPVNNTVNVACGQTVTIDPQFLAPEVNQTVTVAVNTGSLCNAQVSTTSGVTASAHLVITGAACNVGTHPITLTATDNGSPVGVTTVTLNVVVSACCNLQLAAQSTPVSCPGGADGTLDLTVRNGTAPFAYRWSNGATGEDPAGLAPGTYTVTVTDANNCTASGTYAVVQQDNATPVARTRSLVLPLGAAGTASLAPADVDNGSSDNCVFTLSLNRTAFSCADLGSNTVLLTATDAAGNVSTAPATVTVVDALAPTAAAQNVTVQLDANGAASVTIAQVNNGSADNCGVARITVSPSQFSCANTGANMVILTATDASGNASTATATVMVIDALAPSLTAPLALSIGTAAGQCTAASVALGAPTASDNCAGLLVRHNAPAVFPKGTTLVTWTATDAAGNLTTATQAVTVSDTERPQLSLPAAVVVSAPAAQCGAVVAFSPAATDNCGAVTVVSNPASGTYFPVGTTSVLVTATDAVGNAVSATFPVTVNDVTPPAALARNFTVTLANGTATVTPAQLDGGSSDACGLAGIHLSRSTFTCANLGNNPVTLTATDLHGNVATALAVVIVVGSLPTPAITVTAGTGPYTGGVPTTLYLGYGPTTATLRASGGTSYRWSPAAGLSDPTSAAPVFTATAAGQFTYTVTATNQYGCTATASVTLRVVNINCGKGPNDKVLVCHNGHAICISVNAVAAHLGNHAGDQLGECPTTGSRGAAGGVLATAGAAAPEALLEAYPNPFVQSTLVQFRPAASAVVQVRVYNTLGQVVATLFDGPAVAGTAYSRTLSADNLTPGLYLCRYESQGQTLTQRLTVVR